MEDICVARYSQGCSALNCPLAHSLWQLQNLDCWVFFHAPDIEMLDFLAYKYQGHCYFRVHMFPGKGPIVRLASPETSAQVVAEYSEYYSVSPLRAAIQFLEPQQTKAHSFSSEDPTNSIGPTLSWADEMDAHLSELSDDISGEESTPEGNSPVPQHIRRPKPEQRKPVSHSGKSLSSEEGGASAARDPQAPRRGRTHGSCNTEAGETCTDAVLRILKTTEGATLQTNVGWEALRTIWRLGPTDLDTAVLTCLGSKPLKQQQHILLSFAAIDLDHVKNLSAYLNCLIKEHESTNQVCLYFLADLCTDERCCWVHPINTAGWNLLRDKWSITYKDLDYTVLNFLSKKTVPEQDRILGSLADMDLKVIHNLPAYLSSMIQKYNGMPGHAKPGRRPPFTRKDPEGARARGAPHQLSWPRVAPDAAPRPAELWYAPVYQQPPQYEVVY